MAAEDVVGRALTLKIMKQRDVSVGHPHPPAAHRRLGVG